MKTEILQMYLLKTSDSKYNLMKKWKKQIKKYCKIQSPRPICVPPDYFMVDQFLVT
jgi:hypothetical protein